MDPKQKAEWVKAFTELLDDPTCELRMDAETEKFDGGDGYWHHRRTGVRTITVRVVGKGDERPPLTSMGRGFVEVAAQVGAECTSPFQSIAASW